MRPCLRKKSPPPHPKNCNDNGNRDELQLSRIWVTPKLIESTNQRYGEGLGHKREPLAKNVDGMNTSTTTTLDSLSASHSRPDAPI